MGVGDCVVGCMGSKVGWHQEKGYRRWGRYPEGLGLKRWDFVDGGIFMSFVLDGRGAPGPRSLWVMYSNRDATNDDDDYDR